MSKIRVWVAVFAVAFLAAGLSVSASEPAPVSDPFAGPPTCPGDGWKIVRLICSGNSRGGVAGVYGGAGFSLFCDGGSSTQAVCTYGQDYAMRVGQDLPRGVDCFFSGEGPAVAEKCDKLHVVIVGKPNKLEPADSDNVY